MRYDYLTDKIWNAPFLEAPFRHLEIRNFLETQNFERIINSPQISLPQVGTTEELIDELHRSGYDTIQFPGCVASESEYLDWFHGRSKKKWHATTESFGIVFRLNNSANEDLVDLNSYFHSNSFVDMLIEKFQISDPVTLDTGLQKYLHGYEISPHPDIRRKALAWMLNVNPGKVTQKINYHTLYLKLKDQWAVISEFWRGNKDIDRDWLPWDWCEPEKQQTENNSMVFFRPCLNSLHAVKADYDHLVSQHTQYYSHRWLEKVNRPLARFHNFEIAAQMMGSKNHDPVSKLKSSEPLRRFKSSRIGSVVKSVRDTFLPKSKAKKTRDVES